MSAQTHVFHRAPKTALPVAAKGDGIYIVDSEGNRYLDAGDAAVSCLGHSDPEVTTAIKAQLDDLAFAHNGFFTSQPAEDLADLIISKAPGDMRAVYYLSGGSEAVETALKMSRQYHLETGQPNRSKFIARRQSYHGNTLGALGVGGNLFRREPYAPLMVDTSHISPCYVYRDKRDDESEVEYGIRVANELETEILRLGAENVAAFIAETVGGATAGVIPPVEGYFKRIREICDHYGILLILDEVMCGMGRTGSLFACDHDQVRPDIIAIAKGLGAGYQPVGAMLCSKEIYAAIAEGSGFFQHGHTYLAHPVACAAAHAVLSKIIDSDLPSRAIMMGDKLMQALQSAFGQHPFIGDIRGRGLFIGMEFVADRAQKTPFDPALGLHRKIKAAAFEAGLLCYPMGGTIDGKNGDHLLLAPPFILEDSHIGEIIDKLTIAFDAAMPPA